MQNIEGKIGQDNLLFATCANNLGLTYKKMGNYEESENYYNKLI